MSTLSTVDVAERLYIFLTLALLLVSLEIYTQIERARFCAKLCMHYTCAFEICRNFNNKALYWSIKQLARCLQIFVQKYTQLLNSSKSSGLPKILVQRQRAHLCIYKKVVLYRSIIESQRDHRIYLSKISTR